MIATGFTLAVPSMKTRILVAGALLACVTSSSALNITLNATPGIDPLALAGFQLAANYWQSVLADNVTVNINIDFTALGPNILGSTGASLESFAVTDVLDALAFDATTATDLLAVGNLPPLTALGSLTFLTQNDTETGSTLISLDNDDLDNSDSNNNRYLALNSANARALGWDPEDANYVDASITFSSLFSWDFDPSDGIGAGLQDFVGVSIHEMGHALGFVSGVDDVDYAITNLIDLDEFAVFSVLDLYRYSAPGTLDLSVGTASYFSLDGGVTQLAQFSTGSTVNGGDGRQASHWKDNLGLGIMDPTANPAGNVNTPSALDLVAFDAIGWDVVPEPSTALLALAGLATGISRRKR
jgi:hypothetical protein